MNSHEVTPRDIARYLYEIERVGCNCDLDNWEPTSLTGHSHVCRIHKAASANPYDRQELTAKVAAHKGDQA